MNEPKTFRISLLAIMHISLIASVLSCANHEAKTSLTPGEYLMVSSSTSSGLSSIDTITISVVGDSVFIGGFDLHGLISADSILIAKQIKSVRYSLDWSISGKLNIHRPDSVYGTLNLLRDSVVQQLELKLKLISSQGTIFENDKRVLYFKDVEDIQIVTGPIIQVHYAIIQLDNDSLKGYLGVFSQGTREYFLRGTKSAKGEYTGTYITKGINNRGLSQNRFRLNIKDSKISLNGHFPPLFINEIAQTTEMPEIDYSSTVLRSGPSKSSNLVLDSTEMVQLSNRNCRIIQIGPIESANKGPNQWYNVQIGDNIGWLLGGLSPHMQGDPKGQNLKKKSGQLLAFHSL